MKTLKFALRPYREARNVINPDYVYLALVDETGTVVERESIATYRWKDNVDDFQAYWKRTLISRIYKKVSNYTSWNAEYTLPEDVYADWYRWYFFIDGEDAREYIDHVDASQHTTNWQARCGVQIGWKYFKVLKAHNFQTSTAAMLAYSRGYLAGMESGRPFDHEGEEALECLGLTTIEGTNLRD